VLKSGLESREVVAFAPFWRLATSSADSAASEFVKLFARQTSSERRLNEKRERAEILEYRDARDISRESSSDVLFVERVAARAILHYIYICVFLDPFSRMRDSEFKADGRER